jgi:hypothetical protein
LRRPAGPPLPTLHTLPLFSLRGVAATLPVFRADQAFRDRN